MNDVVFIDTNILIYAHDRDAGEKRDRAAQALERLWNEQTGRLSVQVLQEFYVTVTQKLATARSSGRRRARLPNRSPSVTGSLEHDVQLSTVRERGGSKHFRHSQDRGTLAQDHNR